MDQVRVLTKRRVPLSTQELIEELNPVLRGLGSLLQKGSRPKTLPPAGLLDRATDLVASVQAVAQDGLETTAVGDSV
jgi:hypothetical protein